ncbi:hypothetical protein K439DRAFT_1610261 [Ramaria rubella]|nr:hypothetical protein K439DRAFT_1610261 [Ramaria rubella]
MRSWLLLGLLLGLMSLPRMMWLNSPNSSPIRWSPAPSTVVRALFFKGTLLSSGKSSKAECLRFKELDDVDADLLRKFQGIPLRGVWGAVGSARESGVWSDTAGAQNCLHGV